MAPASDRDQLATDLVDRALADEQVARRLADDVDVADLRSRIRAIARERGVRIRTGMVGDDVLAVVRADAEIWTDPAATMRAKLTPLD